MANTVAKIVRKINIEKGIITANVKIEVYDIESTAVETVVDTGSVSYFNEESFDQPTDTNDCVKTDYVDMLNNYPIKMKYSDVDFKAYIAIKNGKYVILTNEDGEAAGNDAVLLNINSKIKDKAFIINENFEASLVIDYSNMTPLDKVLTTKKSYSEAVAYLYVKKLSEAVKNIVVDTYKTYDSTFENETSDALIDKSIEEQEPSDNTEPSQEPSSDDQNITPPADNQGDDTQDDNTQDDADGTDVTE